MMRRVQAMVIGALLLSACAGSHRPSGRRAVTTTTASPHRVVACDVAETTTVRHLPSTTGSVWIWIESATGSSFRVGSLVKVVWRITGAGVPHAALSDPRGRDSKLAFGPDLHPASTFRHPGDEYGTGFTPTAPGCWQLTMRRGGVSGSVSFLVVA